MTSFTTSSFTNRYCRKFYSGKMFAGRMCGEEYYKSVIYPRIDIPKPETWGIGFTLRKLWAIISRKSVILYLFYFSHICYLLYEYVLYGSHWVDPVLPTSRFPAKQYEYLRYFRLKFPTKQYAFLHYFSFKFTARNTDFYAFLVRNLTQENELKPYVNKTLHIPTCFRVP
jgi:hypothetical protein